MYKNHWIYHASASNHSYFDSGLFMIYASAHPEMLNNLANVICTELANLKIGISSGIELHRSKKQLQSALMMNSENRPVVYEDISRQILNNNTIYNPNTVYDMIEKITPDDVNRVISRMLSSKITTATYGNVINLPTLEEIGLLLDSNVNRKKFFI
ncbi:hypothetical protein A3Q56_04307 [Intoshia linei]|uniref:Peptidase M16 C-terminal domain-containing protein n=1 Tax=Intoshia linei TaxID=1819745 RepID=A0A177B108_9BILA|nr:hypothetical protein A3Q56_04307 [Intoshia linei]